MILEEKQIVERKLKCDRTECNHIWISIQDSLPIYCPKCKSSKWNSKNNKGENL